MARKTFPEEGVRCRADLRIEVGDTADSQIIKTITGMDPWDVDYGVNMLQAPYSSDAFGKTLLFETFTRLSQDDAWVYMGLCEKGSVINRSPAKAVKVFICSPFAIDPEWSVRFTRAACHEAFTNGCMPIAPHLYFTQFLRDDGGGYEREYGIAAGHELMKSCDEIHVFVVNGYVSEGMRSDIEYAVNALAMQPHVIRMTRQEAEEYMEEYLENAEKFQGLNPAGK